MGEPMKKTSCQIACVAMGAAAGFVAFVMLIALGGWSFIQAVFGAAVIFILLGGLLSWILCKPLPPLGAVQAGTAKAHTDQAANAHHDATPVAAATHAAPVAPTAAASVSSPAAEVRSGTLLQGEAELAARKGTWTYTAPATDAPVTKGADDAASAPAVDGPGSKPATLTAARGGQPDNLKEIKGIGPKLETMLHGMGFFHFDQIAAWTTSELAWVDQNLTGFKGRASRDNWVDQAKILASGGETAFSKRVEDGDVY